MGTTHHSILFLSGAGLPPWIWDDVRHRLDDAHVTQVAPRPAGRETGLRDYAAAALDSMPAELFTIVAHSAGGVVGAEVTQLAPERVAGLLGVSAIVPRPGDSFLTAMPAPNRWILSAAMRLAGTRPPDSAIRASLAHGLDAQIADRLVADFTPEPQGYYRDRIGSRPWSGRRGYLATAADRELPPALQRRFSTNLAPSWRREIATGHLPMLESPDALAESIALFLDGRTEGSV